MVQILLVVGAVPSVLSGFVHPASLCRWRCGVGYPRATSQLGRTWCRKWVVSVGLSVSGHLHGGGGVSGRSPPCKKLEWVCVGGGVMLSTGKSQLQSVGHGPAYTSLWSCQVPGSGGFMFISETESWDLVSQGAKVAWLDVESWYPSLLCYACWHFPGSRLPLCPQQGSLWLSELASV